MSETQKTIVCYIPYNEELIPIYKADIKTEYYMGEGREPLKMEAEQ